MTTQLLKIIAAGMLAGIALFLVPFIILRILLIIVIFRLIVRLVGGRGRWRHGHNGFQYAFSRRWQHMTDEEKKAFRDKMENDYFSKMNRTDNN